MLAAMNRELCERCGHHWTMHTNGLLVFDNAPRCFEPRCRCSETRREPYHINAGVYATRFDRRKRALEKLRAAEHERRAKKT